VSHYTPTHNFDFQKATIMKLRSKVATAIKQRFMATYVQSDNVLCQLFAHVESV